MADAGSAVESFGGFTRYVDDSGGGDDAGGGGGGDDAGSGGGGDDAGDVAYRRAEAACVAVRKAGAYVRLLERSWRLDRDSAVAAARPRLVAATEHLAGAEAAALAAFAGRAGGPCAYTREGELLIDVLADVALAGFAAELAPARFLCNETFEIREPGAVAYVLRNALEAQCGATAARAARREAGGATQLTLAAGRGDDARVRMLIALGALGQWNLSTSGPAALLAACGARQRRAVEALLAVPGRAVDVNCGALVSSLPDTDLARFLLSRGAHVGNALSYIFRGQPASVMRISTLRLLLDHGANANEQDGEGDTALLHLLKNCSRHGDEQAECAAMRLLLDHGASPNIITKDGLTPLRLAYINGLPDAAVLLRERGAIGPQQRGPGGAGVGGIGVDVGAGVGIGVGNRRQNIELRKLLRRSRPIENPNIVVTPDPGDNRRWLVSLVLPATYQPPGELAERPSPYAGRRFTITMTFPDSYPIVGPSLSFRAGAMYHPLVRTEGDELDYLWIGRTWRPPMMAEELLLRACDALAHPLADGANGVNAECTRQLRDGDLEAFERIARAAAAMEPEV